MMAFFLVDKKKKLSMKNLDVILHTEEKGNKTTAIKR